MTQEIMAIDSKINTSATTPERRQEEMTLTACRPKQDLTKKPQK
jgi:hypothetical protein